MAERRKIAEASPESLHRVFTVPEAPDSTLGRIERDISQNLMGFLQDNIVASQREIVDIERDFTETLIPEEPTFVSDHTDFVLNRLVAESVHTASPSFIGHMTSAIPYFMLPLSKIMTALNQNLVKTETSKVFTPLERQVLAMFHRLAFGETEAFYDRYIHDSESALGAVCSGGTIANLTALWAARNHVLGPDGEFPGVAETGLYRALQHYGYEGLAVLVSERGHYSLSKAADVLGLGREELISVPTGVDNSIDLGALEDRLHALERRRIKVLAVVGIAGTTETGHVDPLDAMASLCVRFGCHFHVDAAWGGPLLLSNRYRGLLRGIERADSISIDAHKQLYIPMGIGIVLFRDPHLVEDIRHYAQYIIRRGSKDLGRSSLEGSRPGMAMLLHAALHIFGRKGYELLINGGIERAKVFGEMIDADPDFELITAPATNILTYRYVPQALQALLETCSKPQMAWATEQLNVCTTDLQKAQRERGQAFVSRTMLTPSRYGGLDVVVFRVVLANPLTTRKILAAVLDEQRELATTIVRVHERFVALVDRLTTSHSERT